MKKFTHPGTSSPPPPAGIAALVHRTRDADDDDTHYKPLEWGLLRRLFDYTRPYAA